MAYDEEYVRYLSWDSESLITDTTFSTPILARYVCGVVLCTHCHEPLEEHVNAKCLYDANFYDATTCLFPTKLLAHGDKLKIRVNGEV